LDLSRDGLLRMARIVATDLAPADLGYTFAPDPHLRQTLGLGPAPEFSGPVFQGQEIDLAPPATTPEPPQPGNTLEELLLQTPTTWLIDFLIGTAHAGEETIPLDLDALKAWLIHDSSFLADLEKITAALREESARINAQGGIGPAHQPLFERLVLATAWQESCFRQFLNKNNKLSYLRSWNNTSVGLMQINERVWRGIYNVDGLRWDPRYNIRAGGEILQTYLTRFALKKGQGASQDDEGIARATYAVYNAGPASLKAFWERHRQGTYTKADALFGEKYGWAKNGDFEKVRLCLFGE